jgi:hypothetical protein
MAHVGNTWEKCVQVMVQKHNAKTLVITLRCSWEDNIKLVIEGVGSERGMNLSA